ncbi:MAG: hypothetical protein KKH75_04990 [Actinobacteria bacterium]|nr:hypothetical protein [Actinomycetota bacterium]
MSSPSPRRHSPAVYRRRRLVLLLAVAIVVAAVVWLLVAQPWQGNAAERSQPMTTATDGAASALPVPSDTTPPESPPATPSAPASDATTPPAAVPDAAPAAQACTAGDVTVDAVTDQSTYPQGQNPKLSIRLTNHGGADCTMNVGSTTQKFTIMSGSDTWWRSTDCQTAPSDMTVLIAAGQTVSSATPITWDRTRSSVSTCDATNRQRAPGGGASYHLSVSIGGVASSGSTQFLLY